MAVTLLEAAKQMTGDVIRQSVIEVFARSTDLLRVMLYTDIQGGAYKYSQEQALPGIAFRGINESYTESAGVLNPAVEQLVILGGDLDVDKALIKFHGEGIRATHEAMKIKAIAHEFSHRFIKGDSQTDPKEFDGLQKRLVGNQLIAAGSTSGGDVLSLQKLDELIDAVDEPNYLLMSKAMRRILTTAARNQSVGGHVSYQKDEFGRQVTVYNDLPILIADGNGDVNSTLGFNEANPGGGSSVGTSIYCMSIQEGMLSGIQNGVMDVTDLGEQDAKPVFRTRVEWYNSMLLEHPRAAARLYGIKTGAAVA